MYIIPHMVHSKIMLWSSYQTCNVFVLITLWVYTVPLMSMIYVCWLDVMLKDWINALTTAPPPLSNVVATRINGTTLRVSWQPLSLVEAQGCITYRVMVTPTTGSRRRQATQEERVCTLSSPCEVPANKSSVIVGGLDCDTSYSVTVNAVNSEDEAGPTTVPITATVPSRVKHLFSSRCII